MFSLFNSFFSFKPSLEIKKFTKEEKGNHTELSNIILNLSHIQKAVLYEIYDSENNVVILNEPDGCELYSTACSYLENIGLLAKSESETADCRWTMLPNIKQIIVSDDKVRHSLRESYFQENETLKYTGQLLCQIVVEV